MRETIKKFIDDNAFFIWFLTIFIALISAALYFMPAANALTLKQDERGCFSFAMSIANMMPYRDSGIAWVDMKDDVQGAINDAVGSDDSFIKDQDDAKLVMDTLEKAWAGKKDSSILAQEVYTTCMLPRA